MTSRRLTDRDLGRVGLGEAGDDLELLQVLDVDDARRRARRTTSSRCSLRRLHHPGRSRRWSWTTTLLLLLLLLPTVSPRLALTAVIVPLIGERRTVSRTAFRADATARRSCATCVWSCATVVASTAESTDACAVLTDCCCCWTVSSCWETARCAFAIAVRSVVHDAVAVREGLHEAAPRPVRVRCDDPEDVGGRRLQPVDRRARPCSRSCRCRRWRSQSSIRTRPSGRTGSSRWWQIPWG